jgi:hypothetical protein
VREALNELEVVTPFKNTNKIWSTIKTTVLYGGFATAGCIIL